MTKIVVNTPTDTRGLIRLKGDVGGKTYGGEFTQTDEYKKNKNKYQVYDPVTNKNYSVGSDMGMSLLGISASGGNQAGPTAQNDAPYGYQKTPYGYGVIPGGPLDPQVNAASTAKAIPYRDIPINAPVKTNYENSLGFGVDSTKNASDIYKKLANEMLTSEQQRAISARNQLMEARTLSEQDIANKLASQNTLLETMFNPRREGIDRNLDVSIDTSNLNAASRGSVRGSRQEDKIINLNREADSARAAVDAQQQAQLALYEAQLRGASAGELKAYEALVMDAEKGVREAEARVAQAKEGVLTQQLALDEERRANEKSAFENFLKESGQYYNPTTGELAQGLSGMKGEAEINKTLAEAIYSEAKGTEARANAQKLLDEITRGNFVTNSFADEFGNTSIQVFNKDTGEFEITDVGKIGPTANAILSAMYGGGGGGGGRGGGGGGDVSALAYALAEAGYTSTDVAAFGTDSIPGLGKLPQGEFIQLVGDMRGIEDMLYANDVNTRLGYVGQLTTKPSSNALLGALGGTPSIKPYNPNQTQTTSQYLQKLGLGPSNGGWF